MDMAAVLRREASINVSIPAGGMELCVQDGRPGGSCGRCCPAKPSFDHAKPDSLPLTHSEWGQFQTKVQNAIAGMKSERALAYFMAVPGCLIVIVLLLLLLTGNFHAPDSNYGSGHGRRLEVESEVDFQFENLAHFGFFAIAIALGAVSVALSMWISNRNRQQDELIRGACSDLARASSGRLTAEYHTFFTGPCRARGRQPHRVIVIAPSQQAHVAAEVVPVAHGAFAQAVVVQPAQIAYAEEP